MISDEIIKVLDNLGERFGIFIDWSDKNVMPYLLDLFQRIKVFNIVKSVYWICIGIISVIIVLIAIKKLIKWYNSEDYVDDWFFAIGFAFVLFFGIIAPIALFDGISDLIESLCLPEKAILEMIQHL